MDPVESGSRRLQAKYTVEQAQAITDLGQDLLQALNKEIARELLLEKNPAITDEEVDKVWAMCTTGNPWDAPILYALIQLGSSDAHA